MGNISEIQFPNSTKHKAHSARSLPFCFSTYFSLHLLPPLHAQAYDILHLLFLVIYRINSSSATTLGVSPMPIKFHTTQQHTPGSCSQMQIYLKFLGLVPASLNDVIAYLIVEQCWVLHVSHSSLLLPE